MDLPPSNSFCRMLTHKLADYYHMTHSFESHIGSVRIFRTPFCRVPPALASMHPPSESSSSTPPPAVLPKKIMRRGQGGEAGSLSAEASKAGSEVGSDPKNKENQALSNQKYVLLMMCSTSRFLFADGNVTDCPGKKGRRNTSWSGNASLEALKKIPQASPLNASEASVH